MEPARAMVKKSKRPHEKAESCNDVKVWENLWMEAKMAGVMGLARCGTC